MPKLFMDTVEPLKQSIQTSGRYLEVFLIKRFISYAMKKVIWNVKIVAVIWS